MQHSLQNTIERMTLFNWDIYFLYVYSFKTPKLFLTNLSSNGIFIYFYDFLKAILGIIAGSLKINNPIMNETIIWKPIVNIMMII